ncbi:hypothetical protein GN956_G558 [Arapaima gigas]
MCCMDALLQCWTTGSTAPCPAGAVTGSHSGTFPLILAKYNPFYPCQGRNPRTPSPGLRSKRLEESFSPQ